MDHKNDLPLMSNTRDITVYHYMLDLECDFNRQVIHGYITLFLSPAGAGNDTGNCQIFSIKEYKPITESLFTPTESDSSQALKDFVLVLDCCDLEITAVEEMELNRKILDPDLNTTKTDGSLNRDVYKICKLSKRQSLNFTVEKWCIRIWKDGVTSNRLFPRVIRIAYSTTAQGASLRWVNDQDKRPCVFSAAMWINNRALMPCQEYGSFSTWEAYLTAPVDAHVITSSDHNADCQILDNGLKEWYYSSRMPLPTFTLALAVGYWQEGIISTGLNNDSTSGSPTITCAHTPRCQITYSDRWDIPCRIYATPSILPRAIEQFSKYFPKCCRALQSLLGAFPFPRLDIVIYPPSCQDMALSNPNQIFLSQSVLNADGSMNIKLAHEMCHAWFGLLIGAKDWTEEWLSEGFATYLEDYVHAAAMHWSETEARERGELRALLRYKILVAEMANTQEDLQLLRPNRGVNYAEENDPVMYVKNGLNANKLFTQVHYLKGYFLLRHLCAITGPSVFIESIKDFIIEYHGCMVLSQDFLSFIFDSQPALSEAGLTISAVYEDWLDCSGMPKDLEGIQLCANNSLFEEVKKETARWKAMEKQYRTKRKTKRKKFVTECDTQRDLESDQLVLLLEELLEMPKLSHCTLGLIYDTYDVGQRNADVRHRWCELVVKHKYSKHYSDIELFLINDQAMGVYLYGEMVISKSKELRELAEKCFLRVKAEMEEGTRNMVHSMLFGTDS